MNISRTIPKMQATLRAAPAQPLCGFVRDQLGDCADTEAEKLGSHEGTKDYDGNSEVHCHRSPQSHRNPMYLGNRCDEEKVRFIYVQAASHFHARI
jgi:hypothetical protein